MEIIEYKDTKKLLNDLKYWSNCVGELHYHGEYDIEESELPEELQKVYNTLWTEDSGSLCYLIEYKENYGIALINEFDEEFAKNNAVTMDDLFIKMHIKANSFKEMEEYQNTVILLGKYSGCDECHEFITILPVDIERELFYKVAGILYEHVYQI